VTAPTLSIVVLAWNELPLTTRCVASIRDNTDIAHELILVDNGSEPEAAAAAEGLADIAIRNPENRGFSSGMNQGLAAASGRLIAFVNNDTELPTDWAKRLIETFDGSPRAGIVLPAVTAAGNPISVREEPGSNVVVLPPFRHLPSGVVYLMDRTTMSALGGWGEEYRIASREDLDLLFKVWCNGLDVILDERVLVKHESGVTADRQLPDKAAVWRRNRQVFIDKWSAPSPGTVPRLERCPEEAHAARLQQAATVAYWMQQRFTVEDALDELRVTYQAKIEAERATRRAAVGELARIQRAVGQPGIVGRSAGRLWSTVRRLIPRRIRRLLFGRFRSAYYRAYPEKLDEKPSRDEHGG